MHLAFSLPLSYPVMPREKTTSYRRGRRRFRDVAKYGSQGFGNPLSIAAIMLLHTIFSTFEADDAGPVFWPSIIILELPQYIIDF